MKGSTDNNYYKLTLRYTLLKKTFLNMDKLRFIATAYYKTKSRSKIKLLEQVEVPRCTVTS